MRLLVTDPGRQRVIAAMPAELVSDAVRNPAFAGLSLWYTEADAYEGGVPPDAMTPVDRENPVQAPISDLTAYAHEAHLAAETRGTMFKGWPVRVDERALTRMLGERLAIQDGIRKDTDPWTFADNVARPVSNADLATLSRRMRTHVGVCLATYTAVAAGVAAGQVTTRSQVDAAFSAAAVEASVDAVVAQAVLA